MVGTLASRTTASIRPAPPRGMTTSTRPRAWIRWVTLARSSLGSSCTASRSSPSAASASRSASDQRRVRARRRRAAAQQHRVAGLQRQPERVDGDVGPALVDHADDAERNPLLAQLQPVGQRAAAQHLTDRVGQARDLPQPVGDAVDALRVQREPVEHRVGCPGGAGGIEVVLVGRQDLVGVHEHVIGGGVQRAVLGFGAQCGQRACRDAGAVGSVVDLLAQVGNRRCLQTH